MVIIRLLSVFVSLFMATQDTASASLLASDIRDGQRVAVLLAVDLERISGKLYLKRSDGEPLELISLPFHLSSVNPTGVELVLTSFWGGQTLISHFPAPSTGTFFELMRFSPELQSVNTDESVWVSPGAYMIASGLRRRLSLVFHSDEYLERSFAGASIAAPDVVAIETAPSLRGRPFPTTGGMYSVGERELRGRLAIFDLNSVQSRRIDVQYDVPPPSWTEGLPTRILKVFSAAIPLITIIFVSSKDVNRRRYAIILGVLVVVYTAGYGALFYVSAQRNEGYTEIMENAFFLVLTILIAFVGYWIKGGRLFQAQEEPLRAAV